MDIKGLQGDWYEWNTIRTLPCLTRSIRPTNLDNNDFKMTGMGGSGGNFHFRKTWYQFCVFVAGSDAWSFVILVRVDLILASCCFH